MAEDEYNEVKETLLKSSGAGLSLSIVIHEFEKIVKELILVVEHEHSSIRIASLVRHLEKLTEGFTALVRKGKMQKNSLKEIIRQALFNLEYRMEAHSIEIIPDFASIPGDPQVLCARSYILMVLMNILDNSIWWLDRKHNDQNTAKKIFITITPYLDGTSIIVADNGPGFSIPTEFAVKPFVTAKPGGMGLGLYIADEIMKSHNGQLVFPEKDKISMPKEMDGAVVGLLFRSETK
jgi:nitrogen fixation/metabolism regulation signal transduction histidine kinase